MPGGLVVIQMLSFVQLFVTPWIAASQASLSSTVSRSLFKFMSIELVMLSNHLILCCPLLIFWSVDCVGKSLRGLPMPAGLDCAGLNFAAAFLGFRVCGTGSHSPGPMIRVPRRFSNISDLIALDCKLVHFSVEINSSIKK